MSVAEQFEVSPRTVRRLYQRFEHHGKDGIATHYDHCGTNQTRRTSDGILAEAIQLRREHPTWGAELIRVIMREKSRRRLPSTRTLQRCFRKEGTAAAPRGRSVKTKYTRATRPHQVWQMDAKDQLRLGNGRQVSWLRVVDEFTGAVLDTTVFDNASFAGLGPWVVQERLRRLFLQWGRPESFRVDNGPPWGSSGDLPTDLAFWLIGLNVEMIWNPPCQPQHNGVVERSQGVGKNWAEPQTCQTARQLQSRLQKMDRIQREEYPHVDGKSRWKAYPALKHSRRQYSKTWEKKNWDFTKVTKHLSRYVVQRLVDRGGNVSLYARSYYVGKHYAERAIQVFFDPDALQWVFAAEDGTQLRTQETKEITESRVVRLDVTHRRNRHRSRLQ